jgi:hypothetical protein
MCQETMCLQSMGASVKGSTDPDNDSNENGVWQQIVISEQKQMPYIHGTGREENFVLGDMGKYITKTCVSE